MKSPLTLGIESSCDETSVAVLAGKRVLSNVVYSSLEEHRRYGGVVPEIASRAQLETLLPCLDLALRKAKVSLRDIDLIAVTQGPGLMGPLLVGLSAAKAIALALNKPIIGVNHVLAHAYAGFMADKRLSFPCLGLVISGGHTLILKMQSPGQMSVLGRTLDDAAGEAFDKVAKIMGLRYPGGPEIDRLAKGQDTAKFYFTRPFLNDSLDFSFSGIKTAVYYEVEKLKKKRALTLQNKKALSAGFQEAVCDVLVAKTLRAASMTGLKKIVVGGGVSANTRLRRLFSAAAGKQSVSVVFPPLSLCQDNAAMIAAYGAALYAQGHRDSLALSSYSDFQSD